MFAQIDVPAHDYMDSDEHPRVSIFTFKDDDELKEEGLKVVIGDTVVSFYPVRELAEKILELTTTK